MSNSELSARVLQGMRCMGELYKGARQDVRRCQLPQNHAAHNGKSILAREAVPRGRMPAASRQGLRQKGATAICAPAPAMPLVGGGCRASDSPRALPFPRMI
jgi:hypothetical protein